MMQRQLLLSALRQLSLRCVPRRTRAAAVTPTHLFRTTQSDPGRHAEGHEGHFYTVPTKDVRSSFPYGLPTRFQLQCKTFNETSIMVRRPGLELITYLRHTHLSQPAVRYLLYGKNGTGKTMTLCHVLHYCRTQGWLILHLPDAHLLVKNCKEIMSSSHHKDRLDQPIQASSWLKHFKASNENFLSQLQTTGRYVWSKRDVTEEGRPLGEVVDQGLTRVKNASDAVGVVLKELKGQSGRGVFRLLVSIDGVNAFWGRTTLKKEDKSFVSPQELTLVHNFRKMVKNDWTGGAIITSVNQRGSLYSLKSSYLPQALLGKEGFDCLDPFIPIQVQKYSQKEFQSCLQYYVDRKWLQHEKGRTQEGMMELLFLCNYNPREMEKICAFL